MWISVKDRLPEDNRDYLVFTTEKLQTVAFLDKWGDSEANRVVLWVPSDAMGAPESFINGDVTHWQELPEPPDLD